MSDFTAMTDYSVARSEAMHNWRIATQAQLEHFRQVVSELDRKLDHKRAVLEDLEIVLEYNQDICRKLEQELESVCIRWETRQVIGI
jgi:predicted translin family RNA/ssDNA-binding protein